MIKRKKPTETRVLGDPRNPGLVWNMGGFQGLFHGWSWEENKLFELALAVVEEDNPDRWDVIAMMVGGRSAEEVEKHYKILLEDLQFIEAGYMDHRLGETHLCLPVERTQPISWTDEDQKMLVRLDVN